MFDKFLPRSPQIKISLIFFPSPFQRFFSISFGMRQSRFYDFGYLLSRCVGVAVALSGERNRRGGGEHHWVNFFIFFLLLEVIEFHLNLSRSRRLANCFVSSLLCHCRSLPASAELIKCGSKWISVITYWSCLARRYFSLSA